MMRTLSAAILLAGCSRCSRLGRTDAKRCRRARHSGQQPRARAGDRTERQRDDRAIVGLHDNPAGSAIVNAIGSIRQIVQNSARPERRHLVIVPGTPGQIQVRG
jgi:hypothetical protein